MTSGKSTELEFLESGANVVAQVANDMESTLCPLKLFQQTNGR